MRQSRFGVPLKVTPQSARSTLVFEPTGGVNKTQPTSDLPLGVSPDSENWITRNGYLEKRGTLASRSTQSFSPVAPILGGMEAVDVTGNSYPFASYATRPVWYSAGSWSRASYVSSYGISAPPSVSSGTYWDMCQVYYDQRDENIVVMASQSHQTLFCWQSGTTVFSLLTGAPAARAVAAFDSFLLAGNVLEGSNNFVQRIIWTDRGSVSSWTGGLSGFQDCIDMKGPITRLHPHDNQVVAFSDQEVWYGRRLAFPSTFDFQPLDRTVGCPYPWTLAETRLGLVWLGKDWNVYALAKGEVSARRIGDAIQPMIKVEIDLPERATACYNRQTDQYELWYPIAGGNGRPQRGMFLDLGSGAWMPQKLDTNHDVTRVWGGTLGTGSSATLWSTWSAAQLSWNQVQGSWQQQFGVTNTGPLAVYAGNSNGTLLIFSASGTSDGNGDSEGPNPGSFTTMRAYWRSGGLVGGEPDRLKRIVEARLDYQADSASSLSVRVSADQGATWEGGEALALGTTSTLSQQDAYVDVNSRYPMVELSSDVGRPRISRVWAMMRLEGR